MRVSAITSALLLASALSLNAQGPLTPPGAPAPTMKSLDQVEPRRPISSLPFTISERGSYYLTGNLQFTAAAGHAITITVDDVTLDLMGFTLSSTSAVTGDAIRIGASLHNIVVKNGAIVGNTIVTRTGQGVNAQWDAVPAGFAFGVRGGTGPGATECTFSQLRISGCRSTGLGAGQTAIVERVTASENGTVGISATVGSVTNSTARNNRTIGIEAPNGSITNSVAFSNGGNGFNASDGNIGSSTATNNGGRGIDADSGTVTNCRAGGNQGDGIAADAGTVTNSVARFNGGDGISAGGGVVAFCKASSNNTANGGSTNINAPGATLTGNNPEP